MIEISGIVYQARADLNPDMGTGLASSYQPKGDAKIQPSSIPSITSNHLATGPLPLTEADVRRIVREEIARALETLKKGQST